MTRIALLLVLAAGACADAHLGDGYGRRTRTALDAQVASRSSGTLPIDGTDARTVMLRHRGVGVPPSLGGSTQQGGGAQGGAYGMGGGASGAQGFNSGSIKLDAVK